MILDDGVEREVVEMNSNLVGVDLPPMLWHEMHDFSSDCILLVVASDCKMRMTIFAIMVNSSWLR